MSCDGLGMAGEEEGGDWWCGEESSGAGWWTSPSASSQRDNFSLSGIEERRREQVAGLSGEDRREDDEDVNY
ncbi:hypothetical protein E2C01_081341 [Portunus trituberculatus]|uniref:Uncharacterized protein n=1 Tax=Portunus trituberculatus TaxID=210409 RepID=A0A5B7ILZ8_PORTR|nr:hypothetical protein [Portunus trituberculatus]